MIDPRTPLLLALVVIYGHSSSSVSGALLFLSPDTGNELPSQISVGNASDVIVEVQCITNSSRVDSTATLSWSYAGNGSSVSVPLMAFGVSQNSTSLSSLLRVYPLDLIEEGVSVFTCSLIQNDTTTESRNVTISVANNLFFDGDLLPQLSSSSLFTCPSVPLLPASTIVSPLNTTAANSTQIFCRVDSDRGSFSSRRVPVLSPTQPEFVINPFNTTVFNATEAAFSCSVRPVTSPLNITWFFQPEPRPTESGFSSGFDSEFSVSETDLGVFGRLLYMFEGVEVLNQLAHSGTSILKLLNVTAENRGFYYCQASFMNGDTLNSTSAFLEVNDSGINSQPIILPPPPSLTVQQGTNVTLPCVTVMESPPTWTIDGVPASNFSMVTTDNNSLSIVNVDRNNNGIYSCIAGGQTANVSLNVEFPLLFTTTPPSEVTVFVGEPINLTCAAIGNPFPRSTTWMRNISNIVSNTSQLVISNASLSDTGVYQCVVEATPPSLSNIVAHTYIRVVELGQARVSPPPNVTLFLNNTPPTITLTCTITDTPLVRISWTTNTTVTFSSLQFPTGFREQSSSQLVLSTSQLVAVNSVTCSAELLGRRTIDTAIVRVFARAAILEGPQPPPLPFVVGDEVVISCNTRGEPTPNVTWTQSPNNETLLSTTTVQLVSFPPQLQSNFSFTIDPEFINNTLYRCVAENTVLGEVVTDVSDPVTVIVGAPPLSPVVVRGDIQSRSINITVTPPFSHFPIIHYIVRVNETGQANTVLMNFTGNSVTVLGLSPFTDYMLTVVGVSRAGIGDPSNVVTFMTIEDVPEGAPQIIAVTATVLNQLTVTWSPPSQDTHNGVIIAYSIQFSEPATRTQIVNTMNNATIFTLTGLKSDVAYTISVAARTVAGIGIYSMPFTRYTIPDPPRFSPNSTPQLVMDGITPNTIPLLINPTLFSNGSVSQFWIVVIKVDEQFRQMIGLQPDTLYPNNTFLVSSTNTTTSTDPIPPGAPYIAAEIFELSSSLTFTVGGMQSSMLNSNDMFANPPLESNTEYAMFVRAFSPPARSSTTVQRRGVDKRQSGMNRQFNVFSSTGFFSATTARDGLSSGIIAVIVLILLLALVIVTIVVIVIFIFIYRPSLKAQPPPSRRGSMRLTDSQKVVLVSNVRKNTELANLTPPDEREPILMGRFPDYVRSLHANSDHLFSEEFELLAIKSPSLMHTGSSMPVNMSKNRYGNINCYDETRVYLSPVDGIEGSDYINANFIDGYNKANCYIACQGPLASTMPDFWRMVWEHNSSCIVMLTNCVERGRDKCYQYWPQTGSISMNDMTVTIVDTQVLAYYTIRTFRLNRGNDRREVKQFHYTAWPDFGVPDHPNPIISFIRRVNNFKRSTDGPDIVHCSAGVGRTGTYISIQSLMEMMALDGRVDVFNFVLGMRNQRNFMVQTEQQYIFIHDALVETIKVGETEISVINFRKELSVVTTKDSETDVCPLQKEFDRLNGLDFPNPSEFGTATLPINAPKNRFSDILPYESYRVKLHLQPGVLGSDYINASSVDGYLRRNQFIITQGPLKSTVEDFWRMVWEHKVSAIVMLCQLEERGKEQSARYWPSDKILQYGDLFVETVNETDSKFFTVREFRLTHSKQTDARVLKQFHYTEWSEECCPSSSTSIINMISLVQKAHHQYGGGPVVVHDSSSVGRAGSFCATNILLERLKVEGMVDVFFTVHSLRRKHPGIVATYDQYLFCFNTVIEFLDSFEEYANFD